MDKKMYLVETVSMFRMRYVVEAEEEGHALDEVSMNIGSVDNWEELSQTHIDETIFSSREIDLTEYMKILNTDNTYMSPWSDEEKLRFINKIDYSK
jgi:hypothetical protein